jgi:hypothetical protein
VRNAQFSVPLAKDAGTSGIILVNVAQFAHDAISPFVNVG